jgi:uncharacterized protein YrrD
MQNNPTIIRKWTELEGMAAVTLDAGKKLGTLDDFYIDPQTENIPALVIKTGIFGHRILPIGAITGTGADAITFANEEQLLKEGDVPQLATMIRGRSLLTDRVMSESGTLVGEISNILLDVANPSQIKLSGYQLSGGLRERFTGQYRTFGASEVLRYGEDVIILPDALAQTLLKQ